MFKALFSILMLLRQYVIIFFLITLLLHSSFLNAKEFKIGIMQDKKGAASTFTPLIKYFKTKGVDIKLVGFRSYREAAKKFNDGGINAMFAGSGVAGSMIIKGIAYPIVRPLSKDGWSTYWAVILVPVSNSDFVKTPDYMKSKKIICCALASSGEFYCRSFLGKDKKLLKAGNHGNAINALSKNAADIAVVKNRVWDKVKHKYPNLKQVGKDDGENPNNALIVSENMDKDLVKKIKMIFLGIEKDDSPDARLIKEKLNIKGYIPTGEKDFSHTIPLLKKAGVKKDFNFNEN